MSFAQSQYSQPVSCQSDISSNLIPTLLRREPLEDGRLLAVINVNTIGG